MELERQNARDFKVALIAALPGWFELRSCVQIDEKIQEFASEYCQGEKVGCSVRIPAGREFCDESSLVTDINITLLKNDITNM